jgi:hypothetical protein
VLSDREPAPFALVWSHAGKTIAYNRMVQDDVGPQAQIFVVQYPDNNGDGIPDSLDERGAANIGAGRWPPVEQVLASAQK